MINSAWMNDVENSPPYPRLGEGDVGCQMASYSESYTPNGTGPYKVQGLGRRYEGGLHTYAWTAPILTNNGKVKANSGDPLSLRAIGTTAIARTIPTHPVVGGAVALAELRREGLPLVPAASTVKLAVQQHKLLRKGYRKASAGKVRGKDAGNEFLNLQFGWAPIVSDLRKLAYSIKNAHKIVDDLHRGSGQKVRRRYEFPTTNEVSGLYNEPNGIRSPAFDGDLGFVDAWMLGDGPTTFHMRNEYQRKRWFSGCYTYYIPPAEDFFGKARLYESYANRLLGTRLTPEVVWNIAPWSWASDWFANAGDVYTNLSYFGQDGLAMQYGYVMESNTSTFYTSLTARVNLVGKPNTYINISEDFTSRTMQRLYASPYGFGVTFEEFTPRQMAITAALGLTMGQRR
jgi:hypothetical protein